MKKILRAQFFSARVNFPMIVMSAMKRRPMSGGIGTLDEYGERNHLSGWYIILSN